MAKKLLGLVVLGICALASLWVCAYWSNVIADGVDGSARERANYNAVTWLVTFVVLASSWVWLLVTTVRHRHDEWPEFDHELGSAGTRDKE